MYSKVRGLNQISSFIHCGKCFKKRPDNIRVCDWAKIETGFTPVGIQVWCRRCDVNIVNIDFQQLKVIADIDSLDSKQNLQPH